MKTKFILILLAVMLVLASCDTGSDVSVPADNSLPSAESSVPVTENSTPEVSTPAPENSEVSDETSTPVDNKPEKEDSWIYSGQGVDTHGVDRRRLDDFLEDSLFVGDSVTDGFKLYVNNYGNLPSVNFFSTASYGYINACRDKETSSLHPKIGGETMYIWEAVEYYEAERVFINFGLNDFGYIQDSKLVECLQTICANIHSASSETEIVFMSCGFFTKNARNAGKGVDNDRVRAKNEIVLNFCKENGYDFIDVSWAYADAEGYLDSQYSYDDYCHLGYSKYNFWEDILYGYAADKILGQYENIETMLK